MYATMPANPILHVPMLHAISDVSRHQTAQTMTHQQQTAVQTPGPAMQDAITQKFPLPHVIQIPNVMMRSLKLRITASGLVLQIQAAETSIASRNVQVMQNAVMGMKQQMIYVPVQEDARQAATI